MQLYKVTIFLGPQAGTGATIGQGPGGAMTLLRKSIHILFIFRTLYIIIWRLISCISEILLRCHKRLQLPIGIRNEQEFARGFNLPRESATKHGLMACLGRW